MNKRKISIKAAKKRKQKIEKSVDRLIIGCCAIVCLIGMLIETGILKPIAKKK